jgi:hypothetical protein
MYRLIRMKDQCWSLPSAGIDGSPEREFVAT